MTDTNQLHAELRRIAEKLPGKWTEDPKHLNDCHGTRFRNPDSAGLFMAIGWTNRDTTRVVISVLWPWDSERHEFKPRETPCRSITVARARGPAAIAKDIERRILTWYLDAYAEQVKLAKESDARRNQQLQWAAELRKMIPGSRGQDNQIDAWALDGHVDSDGEVSLTFRNVSVEQAKALIAAAKKNGVTFTYRA